MDGVKVELLPIASSGDCGVFGDADGMKDTDKPILSSSTEEGASLAMNTNTDTSSPHIPPAHPTPSPLPPFSSPSCPPPTTLTPLFQSTLDPAQIKMYLHGLLSGLAHLHRSGVIHRDVKAANVLVGMRRGALLADFGLARAVADHSLELGLTNRVVTLWYRPPELLMGSTRYTSTADTWAAGCVFAEMLLGGRHLFSPSTTDLEQLTRIFAVLGTPNAALWPALYSEHGPLRILSPQPQPPTLRSLFKIVGQDGVPSLSLAPSPSSSDRDNVGDDGNDNPTALSTRFPLPTPTPSRSLSTSFTLPIAPPAYPTVSTSSSSSSSVTAASSAAKASVPTATSADAPWVTEMAYDLLHRMLTLDPAVRPTCEQCLSHPYFTLEAPPVMTAKEHDELYRSKYPTFLHELSAKARMKKHEALQAAGGGGTQAPNTAEGGGGGDKERTRRPGYDSSRHKRR